MLSSKYNLKMFTVNDCQYYKPAEQKKGVRVNWLTSAVSFQPIFLMTPFPGRCSGWKMFRLLCHLQCANCRLAAVSSSHEIGRHACSFRLISSSSMKDENRAYENDTAVDVFVCGMLRTGPSKIVFLRKRIAAWWEDRPARDSIPIFF